MADFTDIIISDLMKLEDLVPQLNEAFGIEAANHFTESFTNQGFEGDSGLEKWPDVKRRDPSSSWYGFKRGAKSRKPDNHPSRNGTRRKYKKRKSSPITNYSPTATKTEILSSQKSELENSLNYRVEGNVTRVFSDKPYAKVQNDGGTINVFGKKKVKLKPRKFVGNSKSLEEKLRAKANYIFKHKTGK